MDRDILTRTWDMQRLQGHIHLWFAPKSTLLGKKIERQGKPSRKNSDTECLIDNRHILRKTLPSDWYRCCRRRWCCSAQGVCKTQEETYCSRRSWIFKCSSILFLWKGAFAMKRLIRITIDPETEKDIYERIMRIARFLRGEYIKTDVRFFMEDEFSKKQKRGELYYWSGWYIRMKEKGVHSRECLFFKFFCQRVHTFQ